MLSLSPKSHTSYSFAFGLHEVKSDISYHGLRKSGQVKQSDYNLENYRLFIKDKLKLLIHKKLTSMIPYSKRSRWKEKCIIYSLDMQKIIGGGGGGGLVISLATEGLLLYRIYT